nr:MAG TPA: hypothetical protein [Caudoviricetes sp.]
MLNAANIVCPLLLAMIVPNVKRGRRYSLTLR